MQFVQRPGETLYIPNEWMHTTLSLDDTVALSSGFLSDYNLHEFWKDVGSSVDNTRYLKQLYFIKMTKEQRRIVRKATGGRPPFEGGK